MYKPIRTENNPYTNGSIYSTVENFFTYQDFDRLVSLSRNTSLFNMCYANISVFKEAAENYYKIEQINDFVKKIDPVLTNVSTVNKLCTLAENSSELLSKLGCIEYFVNRVDESKEILENLEKTTKSKEFANALNSIKIFPTKTKTDLEYSIAKNTEAVILEKLSPIKNILEEFSKDVAHIKATSDVYIAKEFEVIDEKTVEIKVKLINTALDSIRASKLAGNNEDVLESILAQNVTVDLTINDTQEMISND